MSSTEKNSMNTKIIDHTAKKMHVAIENMHKTAYPISIWRVL